MAVASKPGSKDAPSRPRLLVERIDSLPDSESAFVHIYGGSENAFWLDSSAAGERGRFSFMGDSSGPLAAVVTYDVEAGRLRVRGAGGVEERRESIFDYLASAARSGRDLPLDLPFEFDCGLVGYLGYELKAECDGVATHRSPVPDAALIQADRLIAFDHRERVTYLLAHATTPESGEAWIAETGRRLEALPALAKPLAGEQAPPFALQRSRQRYREDIEACKRYLAAGHSYEICLTNKLVGEAPADPRELYRGLRRANPAPFSAYLRFGDLAVLSSSPERFLAVDRQGRVEARPIKGTSRRSDLPDEDARLAAKLLADPKNRAENVTIVDLVRNDLGRVCEVGSVDVPELMRVETYETVHQLVSCIRGRLRPGAGAAEAIRACFPPGSMTGAPKIRTMEILDELEGEARGAYSGAIGWFGSGGTCDLSVAIRTIVIDGGKVAIGAGGAIVADSNAEDEFEEMMLKASAAIAAIDSRPHFSGKA